MELIPVQDAAARVGLSPNTLRKFIRRRGLTLYENPRDARQKLVDLEELEAALRPRPLPAGEGA